MFRPFVFVGFAFWIFGLIGFAEEVKPEDVAKAMIAISRGDTALAKFYEDNTISHAAKEYAALKVIGHSTATKNWIDGVIGGKIQLTEALTIKYLYYYRLPGALDLVDMVGKSVDRRAAAERYKIEEDAKGTLLPRDDVLAKLNAVNQRAHVLKLTVKKAIFLSLLRVADKVLNERDVELLKEEQKKAERTLPPERLK